MHRNVANGVAHSDVNSVSVVQFAVDVLRLRHVIVCGHYRCGGVRAVLRGDKLVLVDNWLRHVEDVREKHATRLDESADELHRLRWLCGLNVIKRVADICRTNIVRDAWQRDQPLAVDGWIDGVSDGMPSDLNECSS